MVLTLAVGTLVVVARAGGTLAAQVPDGVESFDAAWTIIRDTHFDPDDERRRLERGSHGTAAACGCGDVHR